MAKKSKRGAGSLVKRGGIFYLRYYDGSKTETGKPKQVWHSLKQTDHGKAEEAATTFREWLAHKGERVRLEEALHATAGREDAAHDALRDKLTVAGAWAAFVKAKNRPQCGDLTLLDYAQRWAKFADWWREHHAGARPCMEDVTPDHADAFANQIKRSPRQAPRNPRQPPRPHLLSANRYNKIVQTARLVFTTLASQCGGMVNPFGATAKAGIRNKPQMTVGHRELSEGELRAVCGAAEGELRTMLAIGIFTGLRLHDAACLRWEDVSFPLARITVQPHKTRTRGGKVLVIPMAPVLAAILKETPATERRDYVLPATAATYLRDRAAVVKALSKVFHAAKIVTSKDEGTANKRSLVGFHSLRHSFVSICAAAGIPLAVVQELCGHGSPAIQRAYLHMGEGATRAAVNAIPDVLRPAPELPALPAVTSEPGATRSKDADDLRARIRSWAATARLSASARRDLMALLGE